MVKSKLAAIGMAVALLLGACAPQGRPDSSLAGPQSSAPRRIVAAIAGDPVSLSQKVTRASLAFSVPGGDVLERLVHAGLTVSDERGVLRPQLAEAVPSLENGLWKVSPDGRMETTWRIRDRAQWHDGTALTSDDLLFTVSVVRDRELAVFRDTAYESLESVEALDARTIRVWWRKPLIDADTMFSYSLALPLPKHLLETAYAEDKPNFAQHPYWSDDFVGLGPYRLAQWARGSHAVLTANESYVLGRPKIDEIEVRFIPDANTLIANVLAGAVELTMGRGISLEQALQVRERWREGNAVIAPSSWIVIFPQFINPNPAIIADVRFRRALMHAVDREAMAETVQSGLVPAAHVFLQPKEPDYPAIEGSIVRYEYDPRRAAQLTEGLGYVRGPDGAFQDGAGQRLSAQIWTSGGLDIQVKSMFAVADYWQRIGFAAEPLVVPTQRWNDREYVAAFPAFRLNRQPNSLNSLKNLHSSQTPLPTNSFVGQNYSRHMQPAFDALIDRYFVTIPKAERAAVLSEIAHYLTEQLTLMGLYYDTQPMLVSSRVRNVSAEATGWNAQEWELG